MKKHSYEMDMCRGPILQKVIRFALPLMLTGILQLLYNAADIIVVGQYTGKEALAAVGSTGSLVNLLVNLFMGVSVGTSVAVAQHYGANDHKAVRAAVQTSMALALISGFLVGVIGVTMAKPLLLWMGSPSDVIDASTLYIRIYFLGMPVNMLYTFGSAILRAVGDTRRPLYFLTVAGITNVLLNLVFVLVFHMGVAGVAWATIIAQGVSAVLVLRCLALSSGSIHFTFHDLRIDGTSLRKILQIGIPAGVQGSLFSISNVIIQASVNGFGSVVMAGCAASGSLEGFVYTSMNSIHQACLTFVGQNRGARQFARIRRTLWVCLGIVTVVGLSIGGLFVLFAPALIAIYNPDPAVIQMGVIRMVIICSTYFLCGIMEVLVGQLRGLGYSVLPTVATLAGVCGLRIVWVYTIFVAFPTLEVLYWSYPVSWLITSLIHTGIYLAVARKMPRDNEPLPAV